MTPPTWSEYLTNFRVRRSRGWGAHKPFVIVLLLLAAGPMHAQSSSASAATALQSGHFAEAASRAASGLRREPGNIDLWNLLGIARSEMGNDRGAAQAFEQGLNLSPKSTALNENAGLLFFKTGNFARAKQYLERAVNAGSRNPSAKYSLAASRLRTGETAKARAELKDLESALANVADYWEERGRADLAADPKTAEHDFIRATALSPASTAAWNGAASAAEAQGLDEKALSYLIEARKQHPDDVPILLHFASVCIRRDLGPDALEALKTAQAKEPGNQRALFLRARANISVSNWEEARTLFLQFLSKNPGYAPALYAVAWTDLRLNKRDEARQYLDRSLKQQPRDSDALCDRGDLELEDGDLRWAERDLRAALTIHPDHARANIALGDLLQRRGKLAEAQTHYRQAIASDPNNSAAHYKLAAVLGRQGESQRATEERVLAARLAAESKKASKTQLRLVLPDTGMQ